MFYNGCPKIAFEYLYSNQNYVLFEIMFGSSSDISLEMPTLKNFGVLYEMLILLYIKGSQSLYDS